MLPLRVSLVALWLALLAWAFFVAPPSDGLDGERAAAWLLFQGDPALVATFNLLGVWPMIYAAVLLRDPPQRLPAWPFVVLSFVVGGFALLPYLALRRWAAPPRSHPGWLLRLLTGRGFAVFVLVSGAALILWGTLFGSRQVFAAELAVSPLVSIMTADLLALTIAFWAVLVDDVRRYGGPAWAALLGAIPIVGPPIWLLVRPTTIPELPGPQAGS